MGDLAPQAALQTEAAAKRSIRRYYVPGLLTVIRSLSDRLLPLVFIIVLIPSRFPAAARILVSHATCM